MWSNFTKPRLRIGSPIVADVVAAKTKSPQVGETTLKISK